MSGDFEIRASAQTINITSYMTYDYNHTVIAGNTISKRTRNGAKFDYKFGNDYHRFQIPITGVSCGDATTINSWWQNNFAVAYTEDSSATPITAAKFICKMVNAELPMTTYVDANFSTGLFNGTIILETN